MAKWEVNDILGIEDGYDIKRYIEVRVLSIEGLSMGVEILRNDKNWHDYKIGSKHAGWNAEFTGWYKKGEYVEDVVRF